MYISFASGSQREPHFQWNIGGVGSSGVGHVHFMYISCCLCIIFRVGYAKISRRRGEFQWNMGLRLDLIMHGLINSRQIQNNNYTNHIFGKVNKGCISHGSVKKMLNSVISDTFHRHLNEYQIMMF